MLADDYPKLNPHTGLSRAGSRLYTDTNTHYIISEP